ncbi:MAG: hypothetical protein JEY94_03465 [Melioribacteraceae bacterium]|nr:hypothetical protein [Melioribacteraceae bacterium]
MKPGNKKILLLLIISIGCLFSKPLFGQNEKIKVQKYDPYSKYEKKVRVFTDDEIDSLLNNNSTIKFIGTAFGNDHAKIVSDGIKISSVYQKTTYSKKLIDEASYLPIWSNDISGDNFGLELSLVNLPFELTLGGTYSLLDLENKPRKFGFPPVNPDGTVIDHTLNIFSGYWGFNWIPFMISFKPALYFDIKNPTLYIYPAFGTTFNYTFSDYNGKTNDYHTIGASAEINVRYRVIFLKTSYRKFFYHNNQIESQFQVQFGVWFSTKD